MGLSAPRLRHVVYGARTIANYKLNKWMERALVTREKRERGIFIIQESTLISPCTTACAFHAEPKKAVHFQNVHISLYNGDRSVAWSLRKHYRSPCIDPATYIYIQLVS